MSDRSPEAWAAGAAVLIVAAAGALFYRRLTAPPAPPAAPTAPAEVSAPAAPAATPAALDASDARVRAEAAGLSSNPLWKGWLSHEDLIRRLAAALAMTADGQAPTSALDFLAPHGSFRAVRRGGRLVVDPRSYARYDGLAAAFGSIDAGRAAAAYKEFQPLLQQACAELDSRRCDLGSTLPQAVSELLAAPVPSGPVTLKEKGLGYAFADRSLEALSPAQKQLIRLGPRNEKLVQDKLRELAAAIGLPLK